MKKIKQKLNKNITADPIENIDLDAAFGKLILKHGITDKAAKNILKLIDLCRKQNYTPKQICKDEIKLEKTYLICNDCDYLKPKSFCDKCSTTTPSNRFILLDVKDQLEHIVKANFVNYDLSKETIEKLGFRENSIFHQFHAKNENAISLTLNLDGLQIFNSSHIDCWPIFLTLNQLEFNKRFKTPNIIILGIFICFNLK